MNIDQDKNKIIKNMQNSNSNTFLNFFNSYHAAMLLIDSDNGKIINANKSALNYYGYSLETIANMYIYEINTLSKEQVRIEMQNAMKEKRNYFNFQHRLSCGEIRDVEVYSSTVELNGKTLLLSCIHDITNRDKQIASLQNELDSTLAAIPDLLFELGLDGRYYNIRTCRYNMMAIDPEEILGKTVSEILPPTAAKVCLKALSEANEQGYSEGKQFFHSSKSSQRWFELSVAKKVDSLPEDPRFIVLAKDITKRKKVEQELNESLKNKIEKVVVNLKQKKNELNTIIQEAPNPIMIYNEDGKILFVNKVWKQLSGYSNDEINTMDKWIKKAYGKITQNFKEVTKGIYSIPNLIDNGEYNFTTKTGSKVIWKFSSSLLEIVDGKHTIISSAVDITELKQKDEMLIDQSKHAAMGDMISVIAHQWRQPLSAISMDASNILIDIEMGNLDVNESKKYANNIIKQTQHLSQTIDDFRNFFKPDKEISKVNIKNVLNQTLSIVADSLKNNNIELKSTFETQSEVDAYPRDLMQVFVNIITNAKDALVSNKTKNAQINIKVYEDEKYVNTEICDNGGGVDTETLPKLFDPYFSTKDEKNGVGLGLYMSKMIIEKHLNGVIEAHNKDNGACFTVRLLKSKE